MCGRVLTCFGGHGRVLLSWHHTQRPPLQWLLALVCPITPHLHAWAPLIFASAPLHAGNKAHRKCTQPERGALHCCHSFCPQSDHCSVQQPSRPLLLREHPDLQQCGGVKDITWGPGAYQAVSIFLASPSCPGPQGKAPEDVSSLWRYQFLNPEKLSFRTREGAEAQAWMWFLGQGSEERGTFHKMQKLN